MGTFFNYAFLVFELNMNNFYHNLCIKFFSLNVHRIDCEAKKVKKVPHKTGRIKISIFTIYNFLMQNGIPFRRPVDRRFHEDSIKMFAAVRNIEKEVLRNDRKRRNINVGKKVWPIFSRHFFVDYSQES